MVAEKDAETAGFSKEQFFCKLPVEDMFSEVHIRAAA